MMITVLLHPGSNDRSRPRVVCVPCHVGAPPSSKEFEGGTAGQALRRDAKGTREVAS